MNFSAAESDNGPRCAKVLLIVWFFPVYIDSTNFTDLVWQLGES